MEQTMLPERITQLLDGELNPAEAAELQRYLAQHPEHNETYRAVRRADHLLRTASAVMVGPEVGFTSRFEARLAHYKPQKAWHIWAGLSVLLVGTLIFLAIGIFVGGLTILNTWSTLIDMRLLYYWLGTLGETINQARALLEAIGLFLRVVLIAASQPVFWISLPIAGALAWLWVRLLKTPPERLSTSVDMLV